MNINPFNEKAPAPDSGILPWGKLYEKPYDKNTVDPYTKVRIILMNGTEFESVWFSHQFHRHCLDNDLRRESCLLRRVEQLQQKRIGSLKPIDETLLETTVGYEQVAVDLTAILAKREPDAYVKRALDFALLEDFDHLYRYADLLEAEHGVLAERLVGKFTEIMPGRPTVAEHRHPFDDVRRPIDCKKAAPITKLNVGIIVAAEQQTMNYYMNIAQFYSSDIGRKLYAEIAMIEEQHVSHYGSLIDTSSTWLESWLMHEYTECYLYYSCYKDETDPAVKKVWEEHYLQELGHLHRVAALLKKYEKKEWQQVIPDGAFPELLRFGSNIEYVRGVIAKTVKSASDGEDYTDINKLSDNHNFFKYQGVVNKNINETASHAVIDKYIKNLKTIDYNRHSY
jgi:rubrerythrin